MEHHHMEASTQTVKVIHPHTLPLKTKSDFREWTGPTTLKSKPHFPFTELQPLPLNTKITPWAPKIDQILTKKF